MTKKTEPKRLEILVTTFGDLEQTKTGPIFLAEPEPRLLGIFPTLARSRVSVLARCSLEINASIPEACGMYRVWILRVWYGPDEEGNARLEHWKAYEGEDSSKVQHFDIDGEFEALTDLGKSLFSGAGRDMCLEHMSRARSHLTDQLLTGRPVKPASR